MACAVSMYVMYMYLVWGTRVCVNIPLNIQLRNYTLCRSPTMHCIHLVYVQCICTHMYMYLYSEPCRHCKVCVHVFTHVFIQECAKVMWSFKHYTEQIERMFRLMHQAALCYRYIHVHVYMHTCTCTWHFAAYTFCRFTIINM